MKRPLTRLALFAATAIALTGCATFTDSDVAARVDDEELSMDELNSIAREQLGDETVRADTQTILGILNNWVLDQVLRADLEANGAPLPPTDGEMTNEGLTASVSESFGIWQQTPPTPVTDEEVRARYRLGPVESNLICPAHVLVEDEATANEVLGLLDEGASFAETAAEFSIDGSAEDGGNLPCGTTVDFSQQYIPEFVEAALEAEIGVPVGPVESQFGYHVILLRPYDDISPEELQPILATAQFRFDFAAQEVDVYVHPRYGSFNASSGIVPLG